MYNCILTGITNIKMFLITKIYNRKYIFLVKEANLTHKIKNDAFLTILNIK